MSDLKLIFLDKDGVFVDFHKLWGKVIVYRSQLIAESALDSWNGFEVIRDNCIRVMGLIPEAEDYEPHSPGSCMPAEFVKVALASSLYTNMLRIDTDFSWKEALDIVDDSFKKVKEEFDFVELSEPIPGSVEKIKELHEQGYKLAVLTSDIEENAFGALEKFGIADIFIKVQAGKVKTKDLYESLCKELGFKASETMMVGDTPFELKSAREAGAQTVGLLSGVISENNKEILEEFGDQVLDGLAHLDLPSLKKSHSINGSKPMGSSVTIFSDGASRGNPGDASVGVLLEENGKEVATISETMGLATNNEAEYTALIRGLEKAIELGYKDVHAKADSELMVKQLNGQYKVKSENVKPLYKKVKDLEAKLSSVKYEHIRREFNKKADSLANLALDSV